MAPRVRRGKTAETETARGKRGRAPKRRGDWRSDLAAKGPRQELGYSPARPAKLKKRYLDGAGYKEAGHNTARLLAVRTARKQTDAKNMTDLSAAR